MSLEASVGTVLVRESRGSEGIVGGAARMGLVKGYDSRGGSPAAGIVVSGLSI